MAGQVEAAPKGSTLGVAGPEHHPAHPGLDGGSSAHAARLQCHHQRAAVEAPIAQQPCRLGHGAELSMAQGVLMGVTAVAAPAHATPLAIEHHSGDWNLAALAHGGGPPQQAGHPDLQAGIVAGGTVLHGVLVADPGPEGPQARMPTTVQPPLAPAPSAQRAIPPLPFAAADQQDAGLLQLLEQASARLCQWLGSASSRPPLPGISLMPDIEPRLRGLSAEQLLADLDLVMDGAYNPGHPGALAHLDPPPLAASIVGDLICAGLNNNLLAEELSPSLSRLERSLMAWLAERIGMPAGSGGVPASGGTLSNLMALVIARQERQLGCCTDAVVLASADAHVSIGKAMAVMGLPATALQSIPVRPDGGMDAAALESRLHHLAQQGVPVIAVVATAGTTVRGAVDPLTDIAAICASRDVWLHVDGAIGAVFALSEQHRQRVAGLELADSLTVNPQKLLGITKTSSLLLLARPQGLERSFATGLPYMEPSWGGGHGGESGLQGTRPAEVLKLWLGLRQLGLEGIETLLDQAVARRDQLQQLLQLHPGLTLVSGPLHLLAFTPTGASGAQAEAWSRHTRQLLLDHQLMLSRPLYAGRFHLKAVLGNPNTGSAELERVASLVASSVDAAGLPLPPFCS
jgi:L-2,4-diaminobutyrate decarboxylase